MKLAKSKRPEAERARQLRELSHADLVELAARWLRREHVVVITEMAGTHHEADALGFRVYGGSSTLVECKVSRADFLADAKKLYRMMPESGMGERRYYLCPEGLISADELPDKWGLLYAYADAKNVRRLPRVVRDAPKQEVNERAEIVLLISALRRVGKNAPTGISVRYYTYSTGNRATLGVNVAGANDGEMQEHE